MTEENLLIARDDYLSAGAHIGMKQRTEGMRKFIFKIRPDGLAVLDLQKLDERIRVVAKFLARKKKILAVSRKGIGIKAVQKFSTLVSGRSATGRFYPGTMTNPTYDAFFEPDAIIVVDPMIDAQAITEAVQTRVPVISLCDTFNETRNIDLVIPVNNKGKRSVATVFWLLAREVLKERGAIKSDGEFTEKIEDFEGVETFAEREAEKEKKAQKRRPRRY